MKWIVVLMLCLGSLAWQAPAIAAKDSRESRESKDKKLKEVQERLRQEQQNLEKLKARRTSILEVLENMDKKIHSISSQDRKLQTRIDELTDKIEDARRDINEKDRVLEKLREKAQVRLVALYKMGELGSVKILISAESFSDFTSRSHDLQAILRRDLRILNEFNSKLQEVRRLQSAYETERETLENSREESQHLRAELTGKKKEKLEVVKVIQGEEEIHQKYISELEEAEKKLESLLRSFEDKKKSWRGSEQMVDLGFESRRGTLPVPVRGKLLKKFGKFKDPKFFTHRFHKGIDIGARPGTKVQAVFDGKVVFSGWFQGFGQILIVDHGAGFHTLSAHNQELYKQVGDLVKEGEVIARLASDLPRTGKDGRSNTLFYFEVREKGQSVDPLDWLAKSQFLK